MITKAKFALVLLIIPSLALLLLTFHKSYLLSSGREVELSISGYDPRDLLAGHYLIYTVDYGVSRICSENSSVSMRKKEKFVCLNPKKIFDKAPGSEECEIFIQGQCNFARFEAGIERFYIPESKAAELEKIVLKNKSKIRLSVLSNGAAMVKDIIFIE